MVATDGPLSASRPMCLELRSSKSFVIAIVAVAIFTDMFLYGLIVPVLPYALSDLPGIDSEDQVQGWVSTLVAGFGGAALISSPFFGWAADHYPSRRPPFLAGLVCLALGTVLLMIGKSLTMLLLGRILQGLSSTATWVVGYAMIVDTVGKDNVGSAMGVVGIAMTWSILTGPVAGGLIYDWAGYRPVYIPGLVLIGIDISMRMVMIEQKEAAKWFEQEEPILSNATTPGYGTVESMGDSVRESLLPSSSSQQTLIGPDPTETSSDDGNHQSKSYEPPKWKARLPETVQMLFNPRLCFVLLNSLMFMAIYTSLENTLPVYLKQSFHWSSSKTGLFLLIMSLPSLIGYWIGLAVDKHGGRIPATMGFVFYSICWAILSLVYSPTPATIALLVVALLAMGLGTPSMDIAFTTEICQCVDEAEEKEREQHGRKRPNEKGTIAQAYGLFSTAVSGGQILGPVVSGLLKNRLGWSGMVIVFSIISALMIVPTVLWTDGWLWRRPKARPREDFD